MLWDKMSMFSFKQAVVKTASGTTYSKVLDLKLNKGLGDHLKIFAMMTGAKLTAGTITTKIQSRNTNTGSWADVGTATLVGNTLISVDIPESCGRFVRLAYSVGTTALNRDIEVWAGLMRDVEIDEALKLQNLNTPVADGKGNAGLEDLDIEGDKRNA